MTNCNCPCHFSDFYLEQIGVRPIVDVWQRYYRIFQIEEVLYFFAGSAAHLVGSRPAHQSHIYKPTHVYLRHSEGVYQTEFRSLKALQERLYPGKFWQVHQDILVNRRRGNLHGIDLDESPYLMEVITDRGVREFF